MNIPLVTVYVLSDTAMHEWAAVYASIQRRKSASSECDSWSTTSSESLRWYADRGVDADGTPRLHSRLPEYARRARERRDWTPPVWKPAIYTSDAVWLVTYLVLYATLWLALFGRDAFGRDVLHMKWVMAFFRSEVNVCRRRILSDLAGMGVCWSDSIV